MSEDPNAADIRVRLTPKGDVMFYAADVVSWLLTHPCRDDLVTPVQVAGHLIDTWIEAARQAEEMGL